MVWPTLGSRTAKEQNITYACEAVSFSKTDINKLDNLINRALCKIFSISNCDNVIYVRTQFGIPSLSDIAERRRQTFINNLIDLHHFWPVLSSTVWM